LCICRHPARWQRRRGHAIEVLAQSNLSRCPRRTRRAWGCSSKDIDPAPTIHIVWRSSSAALGRRNKMRRIIHSRSAPTDVVAEVWPGAPQQCHGTGNVRCRHGRATKTHVSAIGGVIAGTSACARGRDIRFDSVTPIDRHRAAAAKGSDVVGAGVQRTDSVRCRIDSRRIHHSRTVWTVVTRSRHHHDTSGGLSFDSSLQCVSRTTF